MEYYDSDVDPNDIMFGIGDVDNDNDEVSDSDTGPSKKSLDKSKNQNETKISHIEKKKRPKSVDFVKKEKYDYHNDDGFVVNDNEGLPPKFKIPKVFIESQKAANAAATAVAAQNAIKSVKKKISVFDRLSKSLKRRK
jgi:hypothetical protein